MPNATKLVAATANAMMDAMSVLADGGVLRFYDGTQPAGGGAVTTLLAECNVNADFAPAASGGVLTANAISADSSVNASGTATWARLFKADGTTIIADFSVGKTSGSDINMSENVLVAGGTLTITSFTLTLPLS